MNKALSARRREKDVFKLRSANYKVDQTEQNATYHVDFIGKDDETQDQPIRHMRRGNGSSTFTCLISTLTKVRQLVFSIASTTPILTSSRLYIMQFRLSLPRRYQPDLDSHV